MLLNVAHVAYYCRVLGPGLRAVVWVQGCPLRCPGCLAPELQSFSGGTARDTAGLALEIAAIPGIEGVTFSGGEPFAQAEALVDLIDRMRAVRDLSVFCYTGYVWEEILARREEAQLALLARTDILVDGPYIDELACDFRWRGSSNQRVLFLSERYRHWQDAARERGRWLEFEITLDGRFFWMGIPEKSFLQRFKQGMVDFGIEMK